MGKNMTAIISDPAFTNVIIALWYAIIAGMFYSLLGYFKRSDGQENFSGDKFLCTVVVGVIAGFTSFYMSISPQQAVTLILADTGLVYAIENIVKAVWRRWIQPWVQKVQGQPAAATTPPT